MIFKIYLFTVILAFVNGVFIDTRIQRYKKIKGYKDKLDSKLGTVLSWIRFIMLVAIPVLNLTVIFNTTEKNILLIDKKYIGQKEY